jgi:hypothetical protein
MFQNKLNTVHRNAGLVSEVAPGEFGTKIGVNQYQTILACKRQDEWVQKGG